MTSVLLFLALTPASAADNIVGGHAADGAWPDTAGIVYGSGDINCTGTLIAPDLVLTAAHCARGIEAVHLDATTSEDGERIDVVEVFKYPKWRHTYDVAVLQLARPAQTAPRQIAADCVAEDLLVEGAELAAVGWGAVDVDGTEYVDELQEGFLSVVDPACRDLDKGCNADVSPGGELLAKGADGVDTCYGDSGGPLYLMPADGPALLAGVTSRAGWSDDPDAPDCNGLGVYVRPDAVMPWIEGVTGRDLPDAVCPTGWTPAEPPPPVDGERVGGCDNVAGSVTGGATGWLVVILAMVALRRRIELASSET